MSESIRAGQFVHISRGPGDYPDKLGGGTREEKDEARGRVPSAGVVVFVSRLAPWATVLLYDMRGPVPRPMYRESFGLGQLNAARPPRGVTP